MSIADDLKAEIQKMTKALDDPEIAREFEGFCRTMQFVFPDVDVKLQLVFDGPRASVVEAYREDADMGLTVDSGVFLGISRGEVDPMDAFMEGQLRPSGDMSSLEKLQILMET